jgi:hypothetical protein
MRFLKATALNEINFCKLCAGAKSGNKKINGTENSPVFYYT